MPTITLLASGSIDAPSPLPVDLEDAIAATQGYAQEALTSKNAAATAATAAHADRLAADADAAATAADRTAVHADRQAADADATQTAADRIAVAADRAAADADAAATAADRTAVHADRVAADAAASAATTARTAADADAAATAADRTAVHADRVAADADAVATAADRAQTGADRAQTGADRVQTAADRVQTGLDRTATDTNAANAAASQAAALGSYNNASALLSTMSGYAQSAAQGAASAQAVSNLSILAAAARALKLTTTLVAGASYGYDTTKDDLADWPKKCVSQSYLSDTLNTATRGTVAAVPAQMVVMGEPTVLSVSMGTDGLGALWKSWTVAGLTCLFARSGSIWYGGTGGLYRLDLITDEVYKRDTSGLSICTNQKVADYNQGTATWSLVSSAGAIASNTVNSIAASVVPLTPPNPARFGLPNPTVFAYNNIGVSTIRFDGVLASSNVGGMLCGAVVDGFVVSYNNSASVLGIAPVSSAMSASWSAVGAASISLASLQVGVPKSITQCGPGMVAIAGPSGLGTLKIDPTNPANSLYRVKTTTYDTGWMVLGKTVLAMAESAADLSAFSGTALLNDGMSYADATALRAAGWTDNIPAGVTYSGSAVTVQCSGGLNGIYKTIATTPGKRYRIYLTLSSLIGSPVWSDLAIWVGTNFGTTTYGGTNLGTPTTGAEFLAFTFTAGASTAVLQLIAQISGKGMAVDNVRVQEVASDRSGSNNDPIPVGAPTRAQVASGADEAAYGGFSAANYFEGPNVLNGATDCAIRVRWGMGNQVYEGAIAWGDTNTYANDVAAIRYVNGSLYATVRRGGSFVNTSLALTRLASTVFRSVWLVCRGTRLELWLDSKLAASGTISASAFSSGAAVTRWGCDLAGNYTNGNIGRSQFLTYAPTPDQIAFMDADENGGFVANAKELLSGANVQAVAFDPDTNQLAASNSTGGTDVFAGPGFSVRVANQKSTTGANLIAGSSLAPSTSTWVSSFTNSSIGSQVAAFASWGGGVGWQLVDSAVNNAHQLYVKQYTADGVSQYNCTVPFKAAAQSYGSVFVTTNAYVLVNLATGAVVGSYGGATATVSALATGEWLITASATPAAGLQYPLIAAASASGGFYVGAGTAAVIFGKPMVTKGAIPTSYSDGLSANDNHKSVAFAGGDLVVATGAGVDAFLGVKPGLRETAGGQGAPKRAFYDPTFALGGPFKTTNTTPLNLYFGGIIREGESYSFETTFTAIQRDTLVASAEFTVKGQCVWPPGGTYRVDAGTPVVEHRSNAGIALATPVADTSSKQPYAAATGLASTELIWSTKTRWTNNLLQTAA